MSTIKRVRTAVRRLRALFRKRKGTILRGCISALLLFGLYVASAQFLFAADDAAPVEPQQEQEPVISVPEVIEQSASTARETLGPARGTADVIDVDTQGGKGDGLISRPSSYKQEPGRTCIALGLPSTTAKTEIRTATELQVVHYLLPSLLETTSDDDGFFYIVQLGYDEGDAVYDDVEQRGHLRAIVEDQIAGRAILFEMYRFRNNAPGNLTAIYNLMFRSAYEAGCEYFFSVNDDAKFLTPGWPALLRDTILLNPVYPNFGVVGMNDKYHYEELERFFVVCFVHRVHLQIFGRLFFDNTFQNWGQDPWLAQVYDKVSSSFFLERVEFENMSHKTDKEGKLISKFGLSRYKIDYDWRQRFDKALFEGHQKVEDFLLGRGVERSSLKSVWNPHANGDEWLQTHRPAHLLLP
eukprot:tig00000367_g24472.t1